MRILVYRNTIITCLFPHFESISAAIAGLSAGPVRFSRFSTKVSTSVTVEKIRCHSDARLAPLVAVAAGARHMIAGWTGLGRMRLRDNHVGLHKQSRPEFYGARCFRGAFILFKGGVG